MDASPEIASEIPFIVTQATLLESSSLVSQNGGRNLTATTDADQGQMQGQGQEKDATDEATTTQKTATPAEIQTNSIPKSVTIPIAEAAITTESPAKTTTIGAVSDLVKDTAVTNSTTEAVPDVVESTTEPTTWNSGIRSLSYAVSFPCSKLTQPFQETRRLDL